MMSSLFAVREISPFEFKKLYCIHPQGAHSRPSQASKISLFERTVNAFKLTLLTIFAKSSIVDV